MKPSILEAEDRFVDIAFKENPDIKDLSDFRNALTNAFDSPRGNNATGQFDEETVIDLFESSECDKKLRENIGDKETDKLMKEVKRGDFEIIKDGVPKVIYTPKAFKIGGYTRKGNVIKPYNKGYRKWSKSESKFLQVRKAKKLSPKDIIYQYNEHFQENPRSSSSLKTKIWRVT